MKTENFYKAMEEVPTFLPVFRLIKVPSWMKHDPDGVVGNLFYINPVDLTSTVAIKKTTTWTRAFRIGPSYLEFVEYMTPAQIKELRDKG